LCENEGLDFSQMLAEEGDAPGKDCPAHGSRKAPEKRSRGNVHIAADGM
jgi:hypothetical protein